MFKKDDYIVCLYKSPARETYIKSNYIFQQKEDNIRAYAKVDLFKSQCYFDDIKFEDKDTVWRYATKEEIAEYNRLGKPFDVTTLSTITLITNNYYSCKIYNVETIFKYFQEYNNQITFHYYVTESKEFNKKGYSFESKNIKNVKEATQEEINWLNKCIELNKFVSLEESKKKVSYIGRKVKVLVTSSHGACLEIGEIGIIKDSENIDFPSFKSYRFSDFIKNPYNYSHLLELLPEDYQETKEVNSCPFKVGDKVFLEKHYKVYDEDEDYSKKLPLNTELIVKEIKFSDSIYGNNEKKWAIWLEKYSYGHPVEKFKPISELKTKPLKDSLDDLLEEAKKRYPIGTKFYPAHLNNKDNSGEYIVNSENIFEFDSDKKFISLKLNGQSTSNSKGYTNVIYEISTKRWAEIIEKNQSKFIVDKWYVNSDWFSESICKFKELHNGDFHFSEGYIRKDKSNLKGWFNTSNIRLATEKEINNYLPKDHPDRTDNKKIVWVDLNLEEYLVEVKKLNLSEIELDKHIDSKASYSRVYQKLKGSDSTKKAKILFEEWNNKKQIISMTPEIGKYYFIIDNETSILLSNKVYKLNNIASHSDKRDYHFDKDGTGFISSCWLKLEEFREATQKEIETLCNYYVKSPINSKPLLNLPETKFQIGDLVIGNEEADYYGITRKGWIGKVSKINKNHFEAIGICHGTETNFTLNYEFFDLYQSSFVSYSESKLELLIPIQENTLDTKVNKVKSVSINLIEPDTRLLF